MSYGVSKWGYSPDPRTPDYALTGFDFGELPPWRWFMKTTGAIFPYEALNDGVLWERSSSNEDSANFLPLAPIPNVTDPALSFRGTLEPSAGATVEWNCSFFLTGAAAATMGFLNELYPVAIKTRSFTMLNQGLPPPRIPNPLVITPVKWNGV